MNREFILNNISSIDVTPEIIAAAIRNGVLSFEDAINTGNFEPGKRRAVRDLISKFQIEDNDFHNSKTLAQLLSFRIKYPQSIYYNEGAQKISNLQQQEEEKKRRRIEEIKCNVNNYRPDELLNLLGENSLKELCSHFDLDYELVINYNEPQLNFNDTPQSINDIPKGFTDVFFWGIPSSGKTCALSAILRTMKDRYAITSPSIPKKWGGNYRDSLTSIYSDQIGYLPPPTQTDRTQYMPFLLRRRSDSKYRKLSFFELSGEVFKRFHELEHNHEIIDEDKRGDVDGSFKTLNYLLKCENPKIHFFFIDYQLESKSKRIGGLTQENYLDAAASYFRDRDNIFGLKTQAVYIVLTKSDQIIDSVIDTDSNSTINDEVAERFLNEKFGNFMNVIKNNCASDEITFKVKSFSIGDVFFNSICKLNYDYSTKIIEELLRIVKPQDDCKLRKILNL